MQPEHANTAALPSTATSELRGMCKHARCHGAHLPDDQALVLSKVVVELLQPLLPLWRVVAVSGCQHLVLQPDETRSPFWSCCRTVSLQRESE